MSFLNTYRPFLLILFFIGLCPISIQYSKAKISIFGIIYCIINFLIITAICFICLTQHIKVCGVLHNFRSLISSVQILEVFVFHCLAVSLLFINNTKHVTFLNELANILLKISKCTRVNVKLFIQKILIRHGLMIILLISFSTISGIMTFKYALFDWFDAVLTFCLVYFSFIYTILIFHITFCAHQLQMIQELVIVRFNDIFVVNKEFKFTNEVLELLKVNEDINLLKHQFKKLFGSIIGFTVMFDMFVITVTLYQLFILILYTPFMDTQTAVFIAATFLICNFGKITYLNYVFNKFGKKV